MYRLWKYWQESVAAENPPFWKCCGTICWKAVLSQITLSVCVILRKILTKVWLIKICITVSRSRWLATGGIIFSLMKCRKSTVGKKRWIVCLKILTPIFMWPARIRNWCPAKFRPIWQGGIFPSRFIPCLLLSIWSSKIKAVFHQENF